MSIADGMGSIVLIRTRREASDTGGLYTWPENIPCAY